jgi:hypothetical protein
MPMFHKTSHKAQRDFMGISGLPWDSAIAENHCKQDILELSRMSWNLRKTERVSVHIGRAALL